MHRNVMFYQEIVENSISYKMLEGFFEAIFRSYPTSVTADFVRSMRGHIFEIYDESDALHLFRSLRTVVIKNGMIIISRICKDAAKNISLILAGSATLKILKMKI